MGTGKALHQTPRVPEVARACPTVWQVVVQTARIADRRRHTVQDYSGWPATPRHTAPISSIPPVQHIQIPGTTQCQVRSSPREAVCKTAHRARLWGRDMRCGGHAGHGKRLAVPQGNAGHDAARILRRASRRPIRRSRKLPSRKGRWTPPRNRAQIRLYNRGRRHQGVGADVSQGISPHLPQVVVEAEQRQERLLVHDGKVRGTETVAAFEGSLRSNISKRPDGARAPLRACWIIADRRCHCRPECFGTVWLAPRVVGFWTRPPVSAGISALD